MFLPTTKNRLSKALAKQIKGQFTTDLSILLGKEDVLETIKTEEKEQFILRNNTPIFKVSGTAYIPLLKCVHIVPDILPKVVVDAGAIKYLINGADLMAPGLLHPTSTYPAVSVGDIVGIYGYGKTNALGVGVVAMDNEEVNTQRTGIAVKIINRLGDKIYSYA
ncbi:malignant T-cell-amplified sequence [Nematocida ausubeli]|nr:malignant T-cell-amplified sequence [Nematocida ausubeli]